MDQPRVIQGDFCNWRPVIGRKVLQLTIEVPIEQTKEVLEKLGQPVAGGNVWVAVALLDPKALAATSSQASEAGGSSKSSSKPDKRSWDQIPLSQQAALCCSDPDFRSFLARKDARILMYDTDMAVSEVRHICGISSRAHLDVVANTSARHEWTKLHAEYQAWLTDKKFGGARHG